jgi:hypothetical protein
MRDRPKLAPEFDLRQRESLHRFDLVSGIDHIDSAGVPGWHPKTLARVVIGEVVKQHQPVGTGSRSGLTVNLREPISCAVATVMMNRTRAANTPGFRNQARCRSKSEERLIPPLLRRFILETATRQNRRSAWLEVS